MLDVGVGGYAALDGDDVAVDLNIFSSAIRMVEKR